MVAEARRERLEEQEQEQEQEQVQVPPARNTRPAWIPWMRPPPQPVASVEEHEEEEEFEWDKHDDDMPPTFVGRKRS